MPRIPNYVKAATVLAVSQLFAVPVLAQDDDMAAQLRECAAIGDATDRHNCYDSVLRPGEPASVSPAVDAAPPSVMDTTAAATGERVSPQPAAPVESAKAAASPPTEQTPTVQSKRSAFGLPDKPVKKTEEDKSIRVVVSRARANAYGKFVFTTDDGQVWVQTDRQHAYVGNTPFNARIVESGFAGFFIQRDGSYKIRVKRKK